jgi:hypothetical protein
VVKLHFGKCKWLLLFVVALLAIVLTLAVSMFIYPQVDIRPDNSNLSINGVVNSVQENYKAEGWSTYHVYRYYLKVNISEVVWVGDDLSNWASNGGKEVISVGKIVEIGYDYPDKPLIAVGQIIECKGDYTTITELPESLKLTISPAISESYLKPQIS